MACAVAGGVLLGISAPALKAQQTPQGQLPVFSSRVELVRVDVQIVNKTGDPVIGLGLDDFQAWLDGHPRKVVSAELVSFSSTDNELPTDGMLRTPGLVPEDSRVFILAIDQMGLSAAAMLPIRESIRQFIKLLRPQDMVGLYEFPYRTPKLDITHDHNLVSRALDRILGMRELNLGSFHLMPSEISEITGNDTDTLAKVVSRECRDPSDTLCPDSVRAEASGLGMFLEGEANQRMQFLARLADSLAYIQGRKTILLVSGGLVASTRPGGRPDVRSLMQSVGDDIANSQTNLYVLHLDTAFMDAYSAASGAPSFRPSDRFESLMADRLTLTSGLEQLAGRAGGALFSVEAGTPDSALRRVLKETESYYVLGVEPSDDDRDGKSHFIRVHTTAQGATVRSRVQVTIPKK